MSEVTLDIDDATLDRMRTAADAAGLSLSAWLTQLVCERTQMGWPAEVIALAGAWRDLPNEDELRGTLPTDLPREQP